MLTFFLVWTICQTIAGLATAKNITEGMFLYSLIVSISAGFFEESARYLVFKNLKVFEQNKNWNSSIMYALGHHGMETIIVGFGLLVTFLVVTYKPDVLTDPQLLEQSKSVIELGFWVKMGNAFERLFVGLIIHACFSCLVMLSVALSEKKYLLIAIGWHFLHDLIGFNLTKLSDHWILPKIWIVFIVVLYTYLLLTFRKIMGRTCT